MCTVDSHSVMKNRVPIGITLPNTIYIITVQIIITGDRSSTVVKVLCYKSEGRWFDPSLCQWILH